LLTSKVHYKIHVLHCKCSKYELYRRNRSRKHCYLFKGTPKSTQKLKSITKEYDEKWIYESENILLNNND